MFQCKHEAAAFLELKFLVLQEVVAAWMKEKADYTYGPENNACTTAAAMNVHHYTQVPNPASLSAREGDTTFSFPYFVAC